MAAIQSKTPRKTGWTPPAAEYQEEYYPVQSFAWIGHSGTTANDIPSAGSLAFDEIEDCQIGGVSAAAHGDSAYLVWRVPQQMNLKENLGVQLVYASTGTASDTTNSVSGRVAWKLSFATIGEGGEMSGVTYDTPDGNGTDFQEVVYSGNDSYSGEAKLMSSSWAQVSGNLNGASESGTNFRHGDLVVFKIVRDSGSAATYVPVSLLGATIRYQRDRL